MLRANESVTPTAMRASVECTKPDAIALVREDDVMTRAMARVTRDMTTSLL